MPDTTARDALERTIHHRLPACSEAELRQLDYVLSLAENQRNAGPPDTIEAALAWSRSHSYGAVDETELGGEG